MFLVTFVLLAGCPEPIIQNKSVYHWNSLDDEELVFEEKSCGEDFPEAPCVKSFTKLDENKYRTVCGKKK
jgi:hypothetical protein